MIQTTRELAARTSLITFSVLIQLYESFGLRSYYTICKSAAPLLKSNFREKNKYPKLSILAIYSSGLGKVGNFKKQGTLMRSLRCL